MASINELAYETIVQILESIHPESALPQPQLYYGIAGSSRRFNTITTPFLYRSYVYLSHTSGRASRRTLVDRPDLAAHVKMLIYEGVPGDGKSGPNRHPYLTMGDMREIEASIELRRDRPAPLREWNRLADLGKDCAELGSILRRTPNVGQVHLLAQPHSHFSTDFCAGKFEEYIRYDYEEDYSCVDQSSTLAEGKDVLLKAVQQLSYLFSISIDMLLLPTVNDLNIFLQLHTLQYLCVRSLRIEEPTRPIVAAHSSAIKHLVIESSILSTDALIQVVNYFAALKTFKYSSGMLTDWEIPSELNILALITALSFHKDTLEHLKIWKHAPAQRFENDWAIYRRDSQEFLVRNLPQFQQFAPLRILDIGPYAVGWEQFGRGTLTTMNLPSSLRHLRIAEEFGCFCSLGFGDNYNRDFADSNWYKELLIEILAAAESRSWKLSNVTIAANVQDPLEHDDTGLRDKLSRLGITYAHEPRDSIRFISE